MKFKVTYYTKHNVSMQTETVEASSHQEAFQMFAVTGCFDIEVVEVEPTPEEMYGADWEADADAVHDLLHPAHEVKSQYECENCQEGFTSTITQVNAKDLCFCCNGNWQDCQNCHPEGTGNDTEDLLASMR